MQLKTTQPWERTGAETRQSLWICLLLVLAVLAVFGQTAQFDFVNYDDNVYVYENARVMSGLTMRGVGWMFAHSDCSLYHPITMISLMLDFQLYGLHAGGYHLTNVLIHAASTVLLFLILRGMTGALWRSAFVAAVFALHPLRAESVVWVAERKDVLGAFFFMLTLAAYLRYVRKPDSLGRYFLLTGVYAAGLLCKPMAVTLPFVLLLLDYWPLGRLKGNPKDGSTLENPERHDDGRGRLPLWKLVKEKIPLLALAAAECVVTFLAAGKAIAPANRISLAARLGNAAVSYVEYLWMMVFPVKLQVPYLNAATPTATGEVCVALLVLLGISAGAVIWRKKRPYLLTGWLWYLGMLFPVIGIVQISTEVSHADRYTYLPGIGLALAGTWAAGDWVAGWKNGRTILGGVAAAVIGWLLVCGYQQTAHWRNDVTLWTHDLDCNPRNYVARYNLGHAMAQNGYFDEAMEQYRAALAIRPDLPEALNNLGAALAHQGKVDEAIADYRHAVEIDSGYKDAYNNLGVALVKKGMVEEAIAQYHKALEVDPAYEDAHYDLGNALGLKGDLTGAIAQYEQALEINPLDGDARDNLGDTLVKNGEVKEAIAEYRQALESAPADAKAMNNLAWLLATTPDAPLRNGPSAAALAAQADGLSGGGNPIILRTLAAAYAEQGNYAQAAATARRGREAALAQRNEELAAKLEKEMKLYEAGAPLRESPAQGDKMARP